MRTIGTRTDNVAPEVENMKLAKTFAIGLIAIGASIAVASAQSGPVATACKDDIPKYCSGKKHGPPEDEVRVCL